MPDFEGKIENPTKFEFQRNKSFSINMPPKLHDACILVDEQSKKNFNPGAKKEHCCTSSSFRCGETGKPGK